MKQKIAIDPLHNIEYDNSHALNKGNYANVYCAQLVEYSRTRKSKKFFICGAETAESLILDDIVIKIPNAKNHRDSSEDEIENEISLLLELEDEPNIVHIKKCTTGEMYRHHEFIGLECCRGGDLFNYFKELRRPFKEPEVKLIMSQIISAIDACHRHSIVHGDIKLENIGLVRPHDITELKLLDFGGSHKIKKIDDETRHNAHEFKLVASPHYIPPELASDTILIKERELIYTDFWELGVVCYILLTGIYPFGNRTNNISDIKYRVLHEELRWPKKPLISAEMKKYVENLLRKKPQERHI